MLGIKMQSLTFAAYSKAIFQALAT